jgi:hypothetical protein
MIEPRRHFCRFRRMSGFLGSALVALLAAASARAADFELGFDGLPEKIQGLPGQTVSVDFYATLTTTNNDSPDGPQGWWFAVGAEGGVVTKISLDGLKVAAIYDENPWREPGTPAIRHDVEVDLGTVDKTGGFKRAVVCRAVEYADRGGRELGKYAGTVIVLDNTEWYVLQPEGTARLARITATTTIPADGSSRTFSPFFDADGGWSCLDESGHPQGCGSGRPVITMNGTSNTPLKLARPSIEVSPAPPAPFCRGDSNTDGHVDIADPVYTLGFLYVGTATTSCRDAADANDDGVVDISDPILVLDRLFMSGSRAVIPPPGIYACGPDPTEDPSGCAAYPSCPPSS